MDSYQTLKEIVDDYIAHMQGVNEMRIENATKELEYIRKEVELFGFLQRTAKMVHDQYKAVLEANEISENPEFI
jgi:hypothetical protein